MKKDLVRVKYHNYLADIGYSDDSKMYCGEFVGLPFKATFQSDTMRHCFKMFCEMADDYELKEVKKKMSVYKENVERGLNANDDGESQGK